MCTRKEACVRNPVCPSRRLNSRVGCHCHGRLFFFFSSRRRHARFKCDWSSDVCSSDLGRNARKPVRGFQFVLQRQEQLKDELKAAHWLSRIATNTALDFLRRHGRVTFCERSEERRVGKERRSRWSPDH